jgi:RNA-binding protein
MTAIRLNPAERKDKRADAHHLHPVVTIGGEGLTQAVSKEIDTALKAHGLIKVRVFSDDRVQRESLLAQIADSLDAAPVQHIGKLLVLWRPIPPKERTERDDRMPGPKIVKVLKFAKSGNHRPQVKKIRLLGNQRIAAGGTVKRAKKRAASPKKAHAN